MVAVGDGPLSGATVDDVLFIPVAISGPDGTAVVVPVCASAVAAEVA